MTTTVKEAKTLEENRERSLFYRVKKSIVKKLLCGDSYEDNEYDEDIYDEYEEFKEKYPELAEADILRNMIISSVVASCRR